MCTFSCYKLLISFIEPVELTSDQLKKLKDIIRIHFSSNYSRLNDVLQNSLPDLARYLFEVKLITSSTRDSKDYGKIMKEFTSAMEFFDKQTIEGHCSKFFYALSRMEGAIPRVAEILKEELLEKISSDLPDIDFKCDF